MTWKIPITFHSSTKIQRQEAGESRARSPGWIYSENHEKRKKWKNWKTFLGGSNFSSIEAFHGFPWNLQPHRCRRHGEISWYTTFGLVNQLQQQGYGGERQSCQCVNIMWITIIRSHKAGVTWAIHPLFRHASTCMWACSGKNTRLHIGAGVSTTVRHLHDLNNKPHKTENWLSNAIRVPRISNACNRYWQHELSWKWNLFTGFWCPMLCFGAAPLPTWRTAASLSPWREGDVLFTAPKVLGWQSYHLYWRPEVWCFQPAPSCFVEKSRGFRSSTTVTASWRKKCTSTTRIYLIQYLHANSYYSGRCEYSKKSTISRNTLRSTLPPVVLGWMFWTSENWSVIFWRNLDLFEGRLDLHIFTYLHSMFSKKDRPKHDFFNLQKRVTCLGHAAPRWDKAQLPSQKWSVHM